MSKITDTFVKLNQRQLEQKYNFIQNYKKANNAAEGSNVDANSNVATKNIATMMAELNKDINIQIKRYCVTKEIEKMWGKELADEYNRQIEAHEIYVHDESALYPYTYSAEEVIVVKIDNEIKFVSFEQLYNLINLEEILEDEEKIVYCKYPTNVEILDKDNVFTKVTRLVKKMRHRDLVRVKTAFGEDLVVTDNHPLITSDDKNDTIDAINSLNKQQLRINYSIDFKEKNELDLSEISPYAIEKYDSFFVSQYNKKCVQRVLKRKIQLNREFGYVVGFFIGDGNYNFSLGKEQGYLSYSQKDKTILTKIADIFYRLTGATPIISYKGEKENCWVLRINSADIVYLFKNYFNIGNYAHKKCLPTNIFEFNKDFALGIIEGIIDSDGSVHNNAAVSIRLSSRTAMIQISMLLKLLGFSGGMQHQVAPFGNNKKIKTNYDLWGVQFSRLKNSPELFNSFKAKNLLTIKTEPKYKTGWTNIVQVKKLGESKFLENNEYIYDITTESNTFMCNGLWTHNCVSITMYPFLLNGLRGLGGDSVAPKHLVSFCGSFINLCFAISSQFCGALATVEFLMYFDYFARKDYGDNYLETHKKVIENCFQQVVYSLNQPAAARGFQSIFWNISVFDKFYLESLFGELVFPDFSKPNFETISKLQGFFMNWFNEERRKALLTFPVITAAMVVDNNGPKDEDFVDMCAEQDSKGNSFFKYQSDSVDSLASCCRLRNELQENTFSYSLGAGGTQSGSLNVITINMNRLVQNASKDISIKLEDYLKEQVQKVHKYQLATKELFKQFLGANMLDVYREGFIDINKQFLTIGINGLLESAEYMGLKPDNNEEYKNYISKILNVVYDENKTAKGEYKVMFNTELVPAENLGVKNYNWDKKDGYIVPSDRACYNSYLYKVEDVEIDVIDKFFLHGKDNLQFLDGGSALHLNLEEYPTKESYKKIYQIAAKTGCNYWTTNVAITCCEEKNCGYIDKRTLEHCSKCGSKNISHATRVIGYLRKIKNYSPERQKEADKRYYHKV